MKLATICLLLLRLIMHMDAKRAGMIPCSGQTYPGSYAVGNTAPGDTDRAYLIEDKDFQFQCCGVVSVLNYNLDDPAGLLVLQIWRQKDATNYELISSQIVTSSTGAEIPENERVSFREGDYLGWYTDSEITYSLGGTVYGNRHTAKSSVEPLSVNPSAYQTYPWANIDAEVDRLYDIQAKTAPSEPPYFTNLPNTVIMKQADVLISGVLVTTISATDRNLDDAQGLRVRMNPDWIDIFTFDTNTLKLTTNKKLRSELSPYLPVFVVEEDHCGLSTTATLTVSVINSAPKIIDLPAYADVHEDTVDETLLHTFTFSDEENEAIWCKGSWMIGQEGTGTPFIVKMISTTAGSSSAGIYLIEWPKLDYDTQTQYSLTVECRDTANNVVSGTFTVNIIENQRPVFLNLANSVEVDATSVRTGSTIFIVSSTDPDGDQVTYSSTCTPNDECPVTLFNSGHVMLTKELLFHTKASEYTLEVTPSDHRASNDPRTLTIFIINISNAPNITNVAGQTVNVSENTAPSTSIFQASATDADPGDTLEFSMTVNPTIGAQMFTIDSTSGVVSTHSSNVIDYERLLSRAGTTTFTMSIMVHDGKQLVKENLIIDVTDVNEAPRFIQPAIGASAVENQNTITTAKNLPDMIIDPDDSSWDFSLNCGTTYNAYFSIVSSTGVVAFVQDYDLDETSLPQTHFCTVIAEDSAGNNATATYFISISYDNEHSPEFGSLNYKASVGGNTPNGTIILIVTATDADAGTDGDFEYSLDQSNLIDDMFFITSNGEIGVYILDSSSFTEGTETISVHATDTGGMVGTATIDIEFTDTRTTTTTTTESNRDIEFIEDSRNVAWLSPAVITIVLALGIIGYIVINCIQERRGPISSLLTLNFKLPTLIRPRLIRERDENNRPMPFGRQRPPVIRHLHAKDLRVAPIFSPEPNPVSKAVVKSNPAASKISVKSDKSKNAKDEVKERSSVADKEDTDERMTVTDIQENESWMDRNPSQGSKSVAPATIVAHPKSADKDYLNPSAGYRTPKSNASGIFSQKSVSPSPSVTLSQGAPDTIRVTPSPLSWNNTGEEDDVSLPDSLRAASPDRE